MATTPLQPIVFGGKLTTSFQDLYVVPAGKAGIGIDAAVFNNYSTSTATYTVRIIQAGASSELNEVITEKNIRAKANDLAPAMIGQALVTGGIIQAKASSNSAISVNITATIVDS
tara:strand:+ start:273 stop:617 length:345 start_codon:yes stop_codon:yes gene_type:complete